MKNIKYTIEEYKSKREEKVLDKKIQAAENKLVADKFKKCLEDVYSIYDQLRSLEVSFDLLLDNYKSTLDIFGEDFGIGEGLSEKLENLQKDYDTYHVLAKMNQDRRNSKIDKSNISLEGLTHISQLYEKPLFDSKNLLGDLSDIQETIEKAIKEGKVDEYFGTDLNSFVHEMQIAVYGIEVHQEALAKADWLPFSFYYDSLTSKKQELEDKKSQLTR